MDNSLIFLALALVAAYFATRKSGDKPQSKQPVCTIMAGINDVCHVEKAVPADESLANFAAMIALAKSKGYVPVVGVWATPRLGEFVDATKLAALQQLRSVQIDYCSKNGVQTIDFGSVLTDAMYTSDRLHPNVDGYAAMGTLAVSVLKPINPAKVVSFGDSITAGYPYSDGCPDAEHDRSWTVQVRQALGVNVSNQGIGGETTREILARMQGGL